MSAARTDESAALNRVRKMMRLAKDAGATEGERDNALRMAYATMAKYNLDALEVDAVAEDDPRAESRETFLGLPWCQRVSYAVAELLFCKYLISSRTNGGGRYDKTHCFIGKRSNVLAAIELSRYLVDSIHREATREQRAAGAGYPFYRSFGLGAATKIRERCRDLRTDGLVTTEAPQGPGTTLVLASIYDRELTANAAMMSNLYPILRRAHGGKRTILGAAAEAGKRYGNALNLTPNRARMLGRSS